MSQVKSPVAPSLRVGAFGDAAPGDLRAAPRRTLTPQPTPGDVRPSLRGKLLYPVLLTILSLATRLVGRNRDGLR